MDDKQRELLARALLGQGMAGQALDLKKLMPIYQQQVIQAQMNGQAFPQFQDWVKTQQPQPNQPSYPQNYPQKQ